MAVLVTGGAGYIGSHMVYALCDAGEDVVVLDNLTTGFWWAIAPQAKLVEGDIGDEALIAQLAKDHKLDAIIHFAGSIVVPESVADPLAYYLNNTVKTRSLIAAAVKAGIPRFVFSSTAAVYGNPASVPVEEDAVLAPISPYGSSKLMSEWMLRDSHAAYGLQYVALRYFNVAGADPQGRTGQSTPKATHLIKVACQTVLGERPHMDIFGDDYDTPDGTCLRDYIHVSDLALAHLDALKHLRNCGASGAYNCGYGQGYSVLDIIKAVEKAAGKPVNARMAPRRAGDPAAIVAASTKIKQEMGWSPQYQDIDRIVESALAWEDYLRQRNEAA
ncbi:MAG TPA: UDP-glucose 4-epimerase GalE [Nordella sp.]|nr:UDP-glucose 4-epimerase GalE [Nordella sp.]